MAIVETTASTRIFQYNFETSVRFQNFSCKKYVRFKHTERPFRPFFKRDLLVQRQERRKIDNYTKYNLVRFVRLERSVEKEGNTY